LESKLPSYLSEISSLSLPLTKETLLTPRFLLEKSGNLEMYYAPHNEYINTKAKIVLIGITPGWTQMRTAYEQTLQSLDLNQSQNQILEAAKMAAGFSGPIRKNLIAMLDQAGLSKFLNIDSTLSLFHENRRLVHTASVIKYPVFLHGQNYTGHRPGIGQLDLLSYYSMGIFPEELQQIGPGALLIPLGRTVESVLQHLKKEAKLPSHTLLTGFPHPSGANGHRIKQFQHNKDHMASIIKEWADSSL
jgi:hypothetical protein